MHPEDFDRAKVIKYIESCYTLDHIETARSWVDDLFSRNRFKTESTMEILYDLLSRKEESIRLDKTPKKAVPPHLTKRAEYIAREEESKSHLKLIKNTRA